MRIRLGDLRKVVSEALKKSDAERLANSLELAAGKMGARVRAEGDFSGKMLNVFARLVMGDADQVEQALVDAAAKEGWLLLSRSERRGTVWWFEPGPELKGPLSGSKVPMVLWHVTPRANVDSILKTGFELRTRATPGGSTRRYSPRIYLATDPKGAQATINHEADWVLLKVDRSKLPKGQKFYVDQEFGMRKDGTPVAVYTLDPIPPSAVSVA